ncbi:MAG TPA: sce7726 family protein [Solirubrobacteraceae bacterium]|nr:sce7726 family protein [Solirubrobacteraceae bacterium]
MRPEALVRGALRQHLLDPMAGPCEFVDELWVPRTNERADLAVLARSMDGFEIKTSTDNLRRLQRQADAYARIFDHCTVVAAPNHVSGVAEILPDWWGVMTVRVGDRVTFDSARPAAPNPSIDVEVLVRLLWRDEVLSALKALGTEPDAKATRGRLWTQLLEGTTVARLRSIVRRALLGRDPKSARIATRRITAQLASASAVR